MTRDEVQSFIDEDINPALESHGGWLKIHEFNEDTKELFVEMGGGCQGCSSARYTLKVQIESFLREEFPALSNIIDVTDHEAGVNPFYQG
tara:strand:- start:1653 stop:1922 length:270 start_codon:yes stop_codon:yes gene_type:complete